ncbi:MAG: hypothetical protein ABSG15_13180 [FCB group bacterium]|jgi:hypothetical protein
MSKPFSLWKQFLIVIIIIVIIVIISLSFHGINFKTPDLGSFNIENLLKAAVKFIINIIKENIRKIF